MTLINYLHTALVLRLAELRSTERDRGDSPIPTAVIIAGLVVAALAVTALVLKQAEVWMGSVEKPK